MENNKLFTLVKKQTAVMEKMAEAMERLGRRIGAMESTMQELSNDITATYLAEKRVVSIERPKVIMRKSKHVAPGRRITAK